MAKPTMDEDPVSRLHHFVFEQRDVDVALDPADIDRRQVVLTREQRDHLSGNAETHRLLLPEPGSRHLPFILNRLEDEFISGNEIDVYPVALRACQNNVIAFCFGLTCPTDSPDRHQHKIEDCIFCLGPFGRMGKGVPKGLNIPSVQDPDLYADSCHLAASRSLLHSFDDSIA
jgi:hypothetical protein